MINKDLLTILSLVFFIYFLGNLFFKLLADKLLKKLNFFIELAYSWIIGNSLLIFLLSSLFFTNKLNLITRLNFIIFFILIFIFWVWIVIRHKPSLRTQLTNWFYLLIILVFFSPLIINSLTSFLIDWDAIAIWFLKSKALFFNNFLQYVKSDSYLFSGQAYPIGIPLIINSYFRIINSFNDQAIQFYFLIYYLNLIFLSFGFCLLFFKNFVNKFIILISVISFYLAANFIIYSHNGYADLPLSVFFVTILSLVYLFFQEEKSQLKNKLISLIAISAGSCLMIKNEAVTFFIFCLLSLIIYLLANRKKNKFKLTFLLFFNFIFLIPFILWQVYLKTNKVPSFLTGHYFDFLNIENLKRLKIIFNYLFIELFNTNKYNLSFISIIMIFIYSLSKLIFDKKLSLSLFLISLILTNQLLSYVYVYVITPLSFINQLESSLERVILQILPSFFLLVIFYIKELTNKNNH